MAAGKAIVTDIIGQRVAPIYDMLIGQPNGPWPVNCPNMSGEHFAEVRGVWTEAGAVKILCVTPDGTTFETYATNVKFVSTPRG